MVHNVPDPPRELTPCEVSGNYINFIAESDSDDAELNEYEGYTVLPSNPAQETVFDDSDTEESDSPESPSPTEPPTVPMEISNFERGTAADVASVWNTPRDHDEPLDSNRAAEVMKAMEGFTLPLSATPLWARGLSDDDWKTKILEKIKNSQ